MEGLRRRIEEIIAASSGRWGIVIEDQSTGDRLARNPDMLFPAASMIKVPIMYEVMRQAADGRLDLDEPRVVTGDYKTGGAGILKELRTGVTMTVRELVTLMIVLSDNVATNMLIDLAGMDAINKTMAGMGLKSTVLRRRMMDFAAARAGRENETCAADLARIFGKIYTGSGLPRAYDDLMLDILSRQQIRDKLPFYLPEETVMAHKTGTLPAVEHDAGLLFLPGKTYIVCVLSGGLAANYQGIQAIAGIGRTVYEYFCATKS